MTQLSLACVLELAHETIGFVTAVRGPEGQTVRLDWSRRLALLPEAREAMGTAFGTPWTRSLLARILDVPLDMSHSTFVPNDEPLGVLETNLSMCRHLIMVAMPDGSMNLIVSSGSATVANLRRRVQRSTEGMVQLTHEGRPLHDAELLAHVCGEEETVVMEAADVEWPRLRMARSTSITFNWYNNAQHEHMPHLTAELIPPLCWARAGCAPRVWRKAEALAAVAVMRHCGAAHMLPLVLDHLAIPPQEWLRGRSIQGRVERVIEEESDTVTFKFVPEHQMPPDAYLRLRIEAPAYGTPLAEWFSGVEQALPLDPL